MSVYSRTYPGTAAPAEKERQTGSSVISIPRDATPDGRYYSGRRVFSRGEGVSWTADLGKHAGKGKGEVGEVVRVSIISEVEGGGEGMRRDNLKEGGKEGGKEKGRDDGVSLGSRNGSRSTLGGSHYYL